ncbi:MAG TPA: GatB/YqeY domain-containing protein [Pyrinomonadaceae bacterium]|jgi:uncharacterized protein YqeY|nr:GatB/YqeY domain-containing protein [Pyrinomonadaceae bacterium]
MSLKEKITGDLTTAMKAKDAERVSTLRMMRAAILNAEKSGGGEVADEQVIKSLQSLVKQRKDAMEQYEKANRSDLADKEKSEAAIIEEYLPKAASQEEVDAAVAEAVSETGATSAKDMGTVMKAAMAKLAGKNPEGKMVSEAVKKALNNG